MNLPHLSSHTVHLPQVTQETESHCGPAVMQQLLSFVGQTVTQDDVVRAARIRSRIARHGTRPEHMAKSAAKLAPEMQFWSKQHASVRELRKMIYEYHWPVGVNWQGLFWDTEEEQLKRSTFGENGHYSVVIDINPEEDKIMIADPYCDFSAEPRVFSLKWFLKRWWDQDHYKNAAGEPVSLKTEKLMFVITPKNNDFPKAMKMLPGFDP